ncbi:MAG: 50S ribosomal protein L19 [Chloroflexi bacterium]|nr:50S ribosomal protein L19 [Chloroflexota bacterium]
MPLDINNLVELKPNPNIAAFSSGDTVRVSAKVVEGDKERLQAFEGVVIRVRHQGISSNFTVRRIGAHGVGVERTFLFYSPRLEKVETLRQGKVRRAKLYYLRGLTGKKARLKEKIVSKRNNQS